MKQTVGSEHQRLSLSEVRHEIGEAVNRVVYGKERIVLTRRGKEVAALVPLDELALIEAGEIEEDLRDVEEIRKEIAREGTVPWDAVKKDLGLT